MGRPLRRVDPAGGGRRRRDAGRSRRITQRRAALAVLLAVLGLAGCRADAGPDEAAPRPTTTSKARAASDCPAGADLKAGTSTFTLTSGGVEREYLVYAPASYTGRARVPVVLEFHGYAASAQQQMAWGNFKPQADRDGFLIVGPQGQGQPRHFNLLGANAGQQDDVAFVADLLDHLQQTRCIDPARIYSTGMSNGGGMTAALACRLSDRIAAFAAVALVVWAPACDSARTVPLIAFHGTADPIVPFNGGQVNCCGRPTLRGAPDVMADWARHDGCTTGPTEAVVNGEVSAREWTGCKPGGVVKLYVINGGGHTWPGSRIQGGPLGASTQDIDATATIWAFFKDKRLS